MPNLGINVGTDEKLAADTLTLNSDPGVFRQAVMEVYDTIESGRKVCATAGTREKFTAFTGTWVSRRCDITAELDNTGVVVIGGSTIVATLASRVGTPLEAGDSVTVFISDLSYLYIDSTVSGDGVTFTIYR